MTHQEIKELAGHRTVSPWVMKLVGDAVAKEREECAEICDGFYLSWINIQGRYEFMGEGASECADAIRARNNK